MKKNDLSALQENCFCFCDEEISREAPFQVPIDIPEGSPLILPKQLRRLHGVLLIYYVSVSLA